MKRGQGRRGGIVESNVGLIQLELAGIEGAQAVCLCVHITDGNHRHNFVCCWHRCFAWDEERCHDLR